MPAGYSNKSLIAKLGIKSGYRVLILDAPSNYRSTLGELPEDVTVLRRTCAGIDFVQCFATQKSRLEARFDKLGNALTPNGMLWICWPKKTACVDTDLSRDVIREIGLSHGLVDVKVCAVDETWSGLKFVIRLRYR